MSKRIHDWLDFDKLNPVDQFIVESLLDDEPLLARMLFPVDGDGCVIRDFFYFLVPGGTE